MSLKDRKFDIFRIVILMIRKIDEKKNFYVVGSVNNLGLIIKVSKRLIRRVELEKKLSLKNDSIIKEEEKVRIVEKRIS